VFINKQGKHIYLNLNSSLSQKENKNKNNSSTNMLSRLISNIYLRPLKTPQWIQKYVKHYRILDKLGTYFYQENKEKKSDRANVFLFIKPN
jgi:hypothetical protein